MVVIGRSNKKHDTQNEKNNNKIMNNRKNVRWNNTIRKHSQSNAPKWQQQQQQISKPLYKAIETRLKNKMRIDGERITFVAWIEHKKQYGKKQNEIIWNFSTKLHLHTPQKKIYLSLVCVLYSRFNVCHIHSLYIFVTQLLLFSKTWQICNFIIHKHSPTTLCVIIIIEILILHFSLFHCFVYFFLIIFLSSFYFQHSIHLCIFIIASKSKTFGDWRVNVHVRQRQLLKIFCAVYALPCDICALCMVQHTQHTDSFECVLEWRPSAVSWYIPSLFIAFRVFDIYETCSDMKNIHTMHML